MNVFERNEVFNKFLSDNGCLNGYYQNYWERWQSIEPEITLEECVSKLVVLLETVEPHDLFSIKMFVWSNTTEVFEFWNEMDQKWKRKFV